jgi:hypothetical protein
VLLGDGRPWEVPTIRKSDGGPGTLPRDMFWDEEGKFILRLQTRYEHIWQQTARVASLFFDAGPPISFEDCLRIVLDALALNYRIGPVEQRVLGLIDTANCQECLWMLVDGPWWDQAMQELRDAEKKSAVGSSPLNTESSTPGPAAETIVTAPVGPR